MQRGRCPRPARTLALVLVLAGPLVGCTGLRQQIRDDQLARLELAEAEMQRTRASLQTLGSSPPQHASVFVGTPALDKALSALDGASFRLVGPDAAHPKRRPIWVHVDRIRMGHRIGVPMASLKGTVIRDSLRARVEGEVIVAPVLDPATPGEARLRVRLHSLRPTVLFGGLSVGLWRLLREVVELGVSQRLPQLDPQLDELPIALTRLHRIEVDATSKEYRSQENFLDVRYRVDTPALSLRTNQLVQAFFLSNGLYLYVRYAPPEAQP